MLKAVNLRKAYEGKTVIRQFSMAFEAGNRYCLMGPSGCGKTTLLRMLMGLEKPDDGYVEGLEKLRLSAVFQENRLLEDLTAYENAALVSRVDQNTAQALLLRLGLEQESLCQPVGTFSGGMKRRVALCRALLADYDALFLDEPYKGLDVETRERVMAVVKEETAGKTVVMVTHDSTEAEGYKVIALH